MLINKKFPAVENNNDLSNSLALCILADLADYLEENGLNFGEAVTRVEEKVASKTRKEEKNRDERTELFSKQGLEDYLRQEGIAVGRKKLWGALNSLEIKYAKVRSQQGGEVYQIPLTPRQLEDLIAILKS